ncbi:MAG: hypothetical protein LBR37_00895 [Erysipelotrichaceae bacterium]|nr:hypothetical protein [Erysipelotrichaceae bacterium]
MRLKASFLLSILLLGSCNNPNNSFPNHGDTANNISSNQGFSYNTKTSDNIGGAFYEVFVHQFADSNQDGIGDFNGLKAKLPYLKDLGVSNLWLMPIHPSDSDHKYDVKDYYQVDSSYGTMVDFDTLITVANTNNIKIIIDLVLNHSSNNHPWFLAAVQDFKNNNTSATSKKDYYNFSWTMQNGYAATQGIYYEARFSPSMPDLNLDNSALREELIKIAKFWLDKGVLGFRLDAVTSFYTGDDIKNVSFLSWFNQNIKSYKSDVYLVGEAWIDRATSQFLDYSASGVNFFNFPMSHSNAVGFKAKLIAAQGDDIVSNMIILENEQQRRSSNVTLTSFLSNHDQDRIQNGVSDDQMKLLSSLYLLTKGHPFIYYGEEIGLRGVREPNQNTDANRRMPMIWNDQSIECNPLSGATYSYNYPATFGAKNETATNNSLLNHYRKVLSIRNSYSEYFLRGKISKETILDHPELASFKLTNNNNDLHIIHNTSTTYSVFDVEAEFSILDSIDTYGIVPQIQNGKVALAPFSTIVYNYNNRILKFETGGI